LFSFYLLFALLLFRARPAIQVAAAAVTRAVCDFRDVAATQKLRHTNAPDLRNEITFFVAASTRLDYSHALRRDKKLKSWAASFW
jgi:hypothetical protein